MDARGYRILGWYQVLGGLSGLVALATNTGSVHSGWLLLAPVGLFLGIGIAGVLLLLEDRWGKTLTVTAQALQVPKLFTVPVSYELYGPLTTNVVLSPADWSVRFHFELGGGFYVGLGAEPIETVIGFNIAAAIVLWLMLRKPAVWQLPTSGGLVTR